MEEKLIQLKEQMALVTDLRGAASVLSWDQETMMPEGGSRGRADQIGRLRALAHQYATADEVGTLLDALEPQAVDLPADSDDAALIRIVRREYDKQVKIPVELVQKREKTTSLAMQAWRKARAKSNFSIFEPLLEQMVNIQVRIAERFAPYDNIYDVMLDRFEPGLTYQQIDAVFTGLKEPLVKLVKDVTANADAVDPSAAMRSVPADTQMVFNREVVTAIGYDFEHGRLDLSTHPFTSGSSPLDVRLTTRFDDHNPISGLMASIHEAGHGMHRQNTSLSLYQTPLWSLPSQAIAESQSRLYENNLGRSRVFWRWLYPQLQAAYTPAFDAVDEEAVWKAVNHVEPSLNRVEADEVTYGLHIILRFEMENDLLNGRVKVADLPAEWNARMDQYLGVTPSNDAEGVLQDIHWSMGLYGYFPDYLLGSIWAVQLWNKMAVDLADLETMIERGEFESILTWLTEQVMSHGVKFSLPELSQRIVGEPMSWQPYMDYLRKKYHAIYQLT